VDVRPVKGHLSLVDSERIMKKHGLHPMTPSQKRVFGKFFK
jgi:hypothetical protein